MGGTDSGAATQREGLPFPSRSAGGRLWLLTALLLAGAIPRVALLADNRFHPDEALYTTLAHLIATGRDPLLAHTTLLVDKPPLFYYLLAGGVSFAWGSEVTARLPALFASLISVALVARLAWQLWRSAATAALAALLLALSPFAIAFSPTAFADPLLVMWMLAALVAVTSGQGARARWTLAGALGGLAVACKQTGIVFLPLVVGLGAVRSAGGRPTWRIALGRMWPFALGLGGIAALVLGWDVLRGPAVNFWQAGVAVNDPGRLARSAEVWPRAAGWLGLLRYATASGAANLLMLSLIGALLPLEARWGRTRGAAATVVLFAFALAYGALLWLVAFPVLDRYLLPLVAILAVLSGRALGLIVGWVAGYLNLKLAQLSWLAGLALVALLASPAWQAARNAYPVGGDHGTYDGIDEVARSLRALPDGSVAYTDSLGWTLGYYLFDAPLYMASFDSPAALAADLIVFGRDGTPRVLVLPGWGSHAEILRAASDAGFRASLTLETANRHGERSFAVYRLAPAAQ